MGASWDSIEEGQEIVEVQKTPSLQDLVRYSAGGGDFNPLHHDYNFPQSKQIGSIIIHGRYKYASLGQFVSDWLGHNGRVEKISCQYRGMDMPGNELTIGGRVAQKFEEGGKKKARVEVWTKNAEGKKTTPGEAVVVFHG